MKKLYILEGADGTGKSTLANAIAEETKGHVLHCSYDKTWNIEDYHCLVMKSAKELVNYQSVVIDRWAPSEYVYGHVFRGKPSYDTSLIIEKFISKDMVWIYCKSDDAVENHKKNINIRDEMFDDMTKVTKEFDEYVHYTSNNWVHIPWVEYDFDKVNMKSFVKEIVS